MNRNPGNQGDWEPERVSYYCNNKSLRKTQVLPTQNKIQDICLTRRSEDMIDLFVFDNLFFGDHYLTGIVVAIGDTPTRKSSVLETSIVQAIKRHRNEAA